MWLLLALTIFFSIISTSMMSYLVMHLPLGPWAGPIFVVVCMALMIPLVSRKWFQEHAIVTIAAGSIGGMIGLGLGATVPSFYFLHKVVFLQLLEQPMIFIGMLSILVCCAGTFAFLIAYAIKDHVIVALGLRFPMSKVVYDIISVNYYTDLHRRMWLGLWITSIFNMILLAIRYALSIHMMSYHMIPMLLPIGFLVGSLSTIPLLIGLFNKIIAINFLSEYYFKNMNKEELLVLFCLGMLSVQIVHSIVRFLKTFIVKKRYQELIPTRIKAHFKEGVFVLIGIGNILITGFVFRFLGIGLPEQMMMFLLLFMVGLSVSQLIGSVGVVSIDGFMWCILLLILYSFSSLASFSLLIIALFVAVCLSMVIDLMFSYKLADLAQISYQRILKYQLLGFGISIVFSAIVMWYYAQFFSEESLKIFAPRARHLDELIQFGLFNYKAYLCGVVSGIFVLLTKQRLLMVIGATLVSSVTTICLVLAGFLSYWITKKEQYFPLCFGMYASQAFWMMIWAILYHHLL